MSNISDMAKARMKRLGQNIKTNKKVVITGLVAAVTGVSVIVSSNQDDDWYILDDSCEVQIDQALNLSGNGNDDETMSADEAAAKKLENAKLIYSVYKLYGLTDNQISGVLGNFERESTIDPTTIEVNESAGTWNGMYGEHHVLGPLKQKAFDDFNSYSSGVAHQAGHKTSAYQADDGKYYCGLGLAQWTGPATKKFLAVAKDTGHDWTDINFQLAYTFTSHYRGNFFPEWKESQVSSSSPAEAAAYFMKGFEGGSWALEDRISMAESWKKAMASWDVDRERAQSIIDMVSEIDSSAQVETGSVASGTVADECISSGQALIGSSEVGVIDLTGPTQLGNTPAGIKDQSWPPDFNNKEAWKESKSPYNTPGLWGQCTWFAWGKFYEIYGYDPGFSGIGSVCVDQLVAAHPDKFVKSNKPVSGAVYSGVGKNHVGIVLWADPDSDEVIVQDGNWDVISNPDWNVAITDWATTRTTVSALRESYGGVVFGNPKTPPEVRK